MTDQTGTEVSPTGTALIPARFVPKINAAMGLCSGVLGLELTGMTLPPHVSTAAKVGAMLCVWLLSNTPGWRKPGSGAPPAA